MKRIFSMVLALAMVLSLGVFPAIAETATTSSVPAPTETNPNLPDYAHSGNSADITYTDTYNDCILMTVKNTNVDEFKAYLSTLRNNGFTNVVVDSRAVLGTENKASIYTKGTDYLVNALWDATDSEAKITIEPLNGLDLNVFKASNATTGNVTPLLIQVGLDGYVDANAIGTHDATDDNAENKENKHNSSGMSYIYRLSDGRFVIYDGGGDGSGSGVLDKHHAARIYKTLEKYNAIENGGAGKDITIAAWYITHPHTDHMGGFMAFTKYYVGVSVKLEKVICYLFNVETQTEAAPEGQSQSVDSGKIEAYNARLKELTAQGVDVYKAHVGQMYYIGNLTIEILFTYDLLSPTLPKAVEGNNVNGDDTVTGYTETVMNRAEVSFKLDPDDTDDAALITKYDAFETYAANNTYQRTTSGTTVTYTYGENTISVTLNSKQDHWLMTYGQTNIGRKRIENSDGTITYRAYSKNDFTNAFSVISQATLKVENTSYKAIWTGDSTYYGIEKVNELYGEAMKSDFVQVPHHGGTQMARDESAATDALKYYHERQVDLFYGDNTTKTQIGTTGHYYSQYDGDGYGYVRAKYVLWPSSLKNTAGYIDGEDGDDKASWDLPANKKGETNDSRRTTWHPNNHLQEEAEAAGGGVYVARNYLTVFTLGTTVSVTTDTSVITADIELPATTDGDYTLVYGADDFKSMTEAGKYKLAKDIAVVNPTTALNTKTFKGTLDGDGHTIKVAYTNNGATTYTGSYGFVFYGLTGATVKNLTVDGAKIVNNTSGNGFNIGFLAFRASGTATIDNVHIVNATFTDNATQNLGHIGGFIGDLDGAANVTIKNSSFNGTVTTTSTQKTSVGGFIGRAGASTAGATVVNIENCTVSGSLSHFYTGGFVGKANTTSTLAIKNSTNNATITAISADFTAAGGFVGTVTATGTVSVQSSINNGTITAKYSGAMIAYLPTKATVKVTDSINNGALKNTTGLTGVASGIAIGFIPSTDTGYQSTITIENCVDFVSSGLGWWRKANAATMTNTPVEKGLTIVSGVTYDDTYFKMTDGVDYVGTEATPTGLRFDVAVNADLITALQNKGYTVTLGALVSTENNVQKAGYVFTVDALATLSTGASGYRVEEIANGDIANFLNGSDSYAITLPDLQNTTREYNAVGFMKITKNSVSTTIYAQYDPAEAKSLSGIQ